jgi:hypothetical protein
LKFEVGVLVLCKVVVRVELILCNAKYFFLARVGGRCRVCEVAILCGIRSCEEEISRALPYRNSIFARLSWHFQRTSSSKISLNEKLRSPSMCVRCKIFPGRALAKID